MYLPRPGHAPHLHSHPPNQNDQHPSIAGYAVPAIVCPPKIAEYRLSSIKPPPPSPLCLFWSFGPPPICEFQDNSQ